MRFSALGIFLPFLCEGVHGASSSHSGTPFQDPGHLAIYDATKDTKFGCLDGNQQLTANASACWPYHFRPEGEDKFQWLMFKKDNGGCGPPKDDIMFCVGGSVLKACGGPWNYTSKGDEMLNPQGHSASKNVFYWKPSTHSWGNEISEVPTDGWNKTCTIYWEALGSQ